jgi:hypothetical protein
VGVAKEPRGFYLGRYKATVSLHRGQSAGDVRTLEYTDFGIAVHHAAAHATSPCLHVCPTDAASRIVFHTFRAAEADLWCYIWDHRPQAKSCQDLIRSRCREREQISVGESLMQQWRTRYNKMSVAHSLPSNLAL